MTKEWRQHLVGFNSAALESSSYMSGAHLSAAAAHPSLVLLVISRRNLESYMIFAGMLIDTVASIRGIHLAVYINRCIQAKLIRKCIDSGSKKQS